MSILKFIIVLSTISFLTSCHRVYRLSDNDYSWMPYKGTETLIFSSKTGYTDTIFLLKKDTLTAYPGAQSLNGITYEEVSISSRHTNPSNPNSKRYLENSFVRLQKSKDSKTRLLLNVLAKDAIFYRLSGLTIDSLSKQMTSTLITKYKTYNDVYIIEDDDWLNFKQRSDYVTKLYWSKSQGLIRYDKQDGDNWELTKKYSP